MGIENWLVLAPALLLWGMQMWRYRDPAWVWIINGFIIITIAWMLCWGMLLDCWDALGVGIAAGAVVAIGVIKSRK